MELEIRVAALRRRVGAASTALEAAREREAALAAQLARRAQAGVPCV
jgi:hypothetical protein